MKVTYCVSEDSLDVLFFWNAIPIVSRHGDDVEEPGLKGVGTKSTPFFPDFQSCGRLLF